MDESVDFYRNWTDYQQGFCSLDGEFWLGLDDIHRLTAAYGATAYAQYSTF